VRSAGQITQVEHDRTNWLSATCLILFLLASQLTAIAVEAHTQPDPTLRLWRTAYAIFLAGVLGSLGFAGGVLSARRCLLTNIVSLLPIIPIMWMASEFRRYAAEPLDPFVGYRLLIVGLAIGLPLSMPWVLVTVSVVALLSLAHYVTFELASPLPAGMGEPWYLLFHWLVAFGIVFFRNLLARMTERYQAARSALETLSRLTRLFYALSDGVATPVQTIDGVAHLLRTQGPERAEYASRLERSVRRLRDLIRSTRPAGGDGIVAPESFRAEDQIEALYSRLQAELAIENARRPSRRRAPERPSRDDTA
jgi:signal transduction histidine kinase